jgi:hypothetical protein
MRVALQRFDFSSVDAGCKGQFRTSGDDSALYVSASRGLSQISPFSDYHPPSDGRCDAYIHTMRGPPTAGSGPF